MNPQKLPADFAYLPEMYADKYYPKLLVDKLRAALQETVHFIEEGNHSTTEIQASLDQTILKTNELQAEFEEHDSELETVARESIAATVENILACFGIDIDIEEAIREREW